MFDWKQWIVYSFDKDAELLEFLSMYKYTWIFYDTHARDINTHAVQHFLLEEEC